MARIRVGVKNMRECADAECSNLVYARGLCKPHYMRAWRDDSLEGGIRRYGGDDVRYHAVHARLRSQRGLASEHFCTCGAQAEDWAFCPTETTVFRETDGLLYSTDLSAYVPLCGRCHKELDHATVCRGASHVSAKLTEDDIRHIRALYISGEQSQSQIADYYNSTQANISAIVRRKTWRHVK